MRACVCVGECSQAQGPSRLRSGVRETTYSLFLTFGRVIWTGDADVDVGDRGGGGDGCRDWHAQQTSTGIALRVHWVPVAHPRQ